MSAGAPGVANIRLGDEVVMLPDVKFPLVLPPPYADNNTSEAVPATKYNTLIGHALVKDLSDGKSHGIAD